MKIDSSTILRLLVVEDDPNDRQWLGVMLTNASVCAYTTSDASTVTEAKALLTFQEFDCVLLDLSLPDSQGLESLQRIRQAAPTTPVVVFTQIDDLDLGLALIEAGAQEYLVKGKASGSDTLRAALFSAARAAATGSNALDGGKSVPVESLGLSAITAPWVCLDGHAAIVAANHRFHDLAATNDKQTAGISFDTFLDKDDARNFKTGFRHFLTGDPTPFVRRVNLVCGDQAPLPAMLTATPLESATWNGILVLITPGRRAIPMPSAG